MLAKLASEIVELPADAALQVAPSPHFDEGRAFEHVTLQRAVSCELEELEYLGGGEREVDSSCTGVALVKGGTIDPVVEATALDQEDVDREIWLERGRVDHR